MNKIDEIALRVERETDAQFAGQGPSANWIDTYRKALLAELSKDAEPGSGKALSEKMKLLASNACWAHSAPHNEPVNAEVLQELYSLIDQACIALDSPPAPVIASEQKPVAWGISVEDEMCDAYINKDACVSEFDRRNKLYPDTPRILVELFTSPPNTADIEQRVAENFVSKFKRHVGGDGEFWLHELECFCEEGKWREYL